MHLPNRIIYLITSIILKAKTTCTEKKFFVFLFSQIIVQKIFASKALILQHFL